MMKKMIIFVSCIFTLFTSAAVPAGEDKQQSEMYIYATYLKCDVTRQKQVDKVIKKNYMPFYASAVQDGSINGWGWMAHFVGGEWRRALYFMAPSVNQLLAEQQRIFDKIDAHGVDKENFFSQVCNSHDDYIWKIEAGSDLKKTRGHVGLSIYMECSLADEQRADEIVKNVFAPIYNQNIGKGKLSSWGWASHVIGGKFRRLATLTAENQDDLLDYRAKILATLFSPNGPKEAKEFLSICTSSQDYLWNIQLESP